jgi:hypothetical protein
LRHSTARSIAATVATTIATATARTPKELQREGGNRGDAELAHRRDRHRRWRRGRHPALPP